MRIEHPAENFDAWREAFDYLGPVVSVSLAGGSATEVRQTAELIAGRYEK